MPEEQEASCFVNQWKKFIWENRDFIVDSEVILKYITKFVLFGHERNRTCVELEGTLEKRFVMYNIWCVKSKHWYPAKSGERLIVSTDRFTLSMVWTQERSIMTVERPAALKIASSVKERPNSLNITHKTQHSHCGTVTKNREEKKRWDKGG